MEVEPVDKEEVIGAPDYPPHWADRDVGGGVGAELNASLLSPRTITEDIPATLRTVIKFCLRLILTTLGWSILTCFVVFLVVLLSAVGRVVYLARRYGVEWEDFLHILATIRSIPVYRRLYLAVLAAQNDGYTIPRMILGFNRWTY